MEIKLLIFDLDGVLVKTGNIHLAALNASLAEIDPSYQISEEDDLKYYGTVTTIDKLDILSKRTGFPREYHKKIIQLKRKHTLEILDALPLEKYYNKNVENVLSKLCKKYMLSVASNTNYEFITKVLSNTGILKYFDFIYANHDVVFTKPHPQIYFESFNHNNLLPSECMIFEDSMTGQEAAIRSGAHVYPIESPEDLNYEEIQEKINSIKPPIIKWKSNKINVLIPMAGEGSRFKEAGYITPKPIIDVNGLPMVGLVAEKLNIDANFIFVVKGEHCEQYNLETILKLMHPSCSIVKAWGKQGGAACSVLEAKELINNDKHLLIVNSDQIWDWNSRLFYQTMISENLDGGIVTFEDPDKNPKWSFAKINEEGFVTEVAEKNPISTLATAGIYYYKHGSDFVKYAQQMIDKNIKVNNEFYVCPVYNEIIQDGKKVKTFNIEKMWGLGIPEDLQYYLQHNPKNNV